MVQGRVLNLLSKSSFVRIYTAIKRNDPRDMFYFIFNETGLFAFKDEMEGKSKSLLASNLKIIDKAKTTDDEFIKMRNSAAEYLEGVQLDWLCGDDKKFIDLSDKKYRYKL
jgi:hypothetical protein